MNMKAVLMDLIIHKAKDKIKLNLWTVEYAKGYCYGHLEASDPDNDTYDRYANRIDDIS